MVVVVAMMAVLMGVPMVVVVAMMGVPMVMAMMGVLMVVAMMGVPMVVAMMGVLMVVAMMGVPMVVAMMGVLMVVVVAAATKHGRQRLAMAAVLVEVVVLEVLVGRVAVVLVPMRGGGQEAEGQRGSHDGSHAGGHVFPWVEEGRRHEAMGRRVGEMQLWEKRSSAGISAGIIEMRKGIEQPWGSEPPLGSVEVS